MRWALNTQAPSLYGIENHFERMTEKNESTYTEYSLTHYYKQGDDLDFYLENSDNNIPRALRAWASHLLNAARINLDLAEEIERYQDKHPDEEIGVTADTHIILFWGPDELMEILASQGLLESEEYEWEDEGEEEGVIS